MDQQRLFADALLGAFEPPLKPETLLRMEVNLYIPPKLPEPPHIALRIGVDRLYVVRNLSAFLRALADHQPVSFGKGFAFDPASMRFDGTDARILSVLSEIEEAQRSLEQAQSGKFMPLGGIATARVLRLLMARPFRLARGDTLVAHDPIANERVPILCDLAEDGGGLLLCLRLPHDLSPVTADLEFAAHAGRILHVARAQRSVLRALLPAMKQGEARVRFSPAETRRVIAEALPLLEAAADVKLEGALASRVWREKLTARAYIDREGSEVVVRVEFRYGEKVIDPFGVSANGEIGETLLVRDAAGEHQVLETLAHSGFHVRAGTIHLRDSRRVLRFILEGVSALRRVAEVFASDAFTRMRPRRPRLSGRLGMQGGAMELSLYDGEVEMGEVQDILRALSERKRYFRLRDGEFLDLQNLGEWTELADLLADAHDAEDTDAQGTPDAPALGMPLRAYRAAYLVSLLSGRALPVTVDDAVRKAADALNDAGDPPPESLRDVLRPYQARGFSWILALYRMRMGGVLADDMGLGKTLQAIAAILRAKEKDGGAPCLVVAPTSLVYNWLSELSRFAPGLSATVVEGSQRVRFIRWAEIARRDDMDVVITSYPLLRRDIAQIGTIPFRFAILDEAQHIKNASSQAAQAASRLNARVRLALTGTPMENNPGELWSIFHFALPGYLSDLPSFMRRHGDGSDAAGLARRIRPFLMRRLKRDVLPELPEKIESRVLADMPAEQRNVYAAATLRLRERVERVLSERGLSRGRMEILSAITQLRQICCHPQLVLSGYAGSSGKLDALMELLSGALASGRRALLFSQFTSMLDILRRHLAAEGISTLYLDGKTPVGQRLELVNRFNDGEASVFLISLKAGGAGLNLTGADTVIHYDPWWNPAAEDQATDRAHRIGQARVVQVIRLITRGTIEEQVARLSERKRALFDAVVTAGETLPSELTEAEIVSLFS